MRIARKKELSLSDSMCIIVGIVVGAGIYETAPTVAACMGSWAGTFGLWLLGGILVLTGALYYGELATAYPREEKLLRQTCKIKCRPLQIIA